MSMQAIREFMNQHATAAAGLTALGAALEEKASGQPMSPALAARVRELLSALGGPASLDGLSAAEALPLLAELRFTLGLDAKLLYGQARAPGWSYTDAAILQAGGDTSAGFAQGLTRAVAPALEGLSERLAAPGAAFLDVGVGVAGLAIALAQLWPELRVTGIDPWQPSLALARENVGKAGLSERIELREQGIENLQDEHAFDLAWLPTPFMPERVLPEACRRARHALRPGGWALMAMANPGDDARSAALVRLRTSLWGGPLYDGAQAEGVLTDAGLTDVRTLPSPPGAVTLLVAGRRAPG